MAKIKRQLMAHYIDASATGTPAYTRLGKDLEEYNVELNAEVNSAQNILGETSKTISSYEAQASVEPFYADEDDPMFTRLQKIIDDRQTLDDLKTTTVEVHLWEPITETPGSFAAYKEDALIEVSSYGGDSTGYQIAFNVHNIGNRVKGEFAVATKTFTAD
ncbi:hypothetical protein HNQ56_003737 [Anaerotaenia torta]|uniref:hypothetical protein n=1 Tax=Anaerotaenia torta TaxID=433293 RepID=UPI003D25FDE4